MSIYIARVAAGAVPRLGVNKKETENIIKLD